MLWEVEIELYVQSESGSPWVSNFSLLKMKSGWAISTKVLLAVYCNILLEVIVFLTFNLGKVWIKCVLEKALSESLEGTFCLATHTARKVGPQHLVSNFHQHQILRKNKYSSAT